MSITCTKIEKATNRRERLSIWSGFKLLGLHTLMSVQLTTGIVNSAELLWFTAVNGSWGAGEMDGDLLKVDNFAELYQFLMSVLQCWDKLLSNQKHTFYPTL